MNKIILRLAIPLMAFVLACNLLQAAPSNPVVATPSTPTKIATAAPTARPSPTTRPVPTAVPTDLVWFGPNMGSVDYAELFTKPEQWAAARSRIDVFKFHSQNVLPYPCTICGDNTLDTFVEAKAFQKLTEWGIPIDVDVGALKEWGCNGTEEFRVVKEVIRNIRNHGGDVTFLDMDEPYMGGELTANGKTCGFTMEQSADITAKWMRLVKGAYPNIIVSNTEPYPYFSVSELEKWIEALEARGTTPASFHLDVDFWRARVEGRNLASDLQALSQFSSAHGIPFGVIITSAWNEAGTDREFYDSTMEWVSTVKAAIGRPQHVVFNAWQGPAPSGAHEVPINLPDSDASIYSHTRLILEGLKVLGP